ncbi:MAG: hypothetical protein AAFW98_10510 [Pseudomonadota bacterium]
MSAHQVERLDDEGDGLVTVDGAARAIPLAVPGDTVTFIGGGPQIVPISPARADPVCHLFGRCGGCRVQHLADDAYASWKRDRLVMALMRKGLDVPVAPMARAPLASRRRLTMSATRRGGTTIAGFFARASHQLVDVPHCPALAPPLGRALPGLRDLLLAAAQKTGEARLTATLCDNGIDAALLTPPTQGRRKKPKRPPPLMADDPAIIRVSLDGETLFQREPPIVCFDGISVPFPPGAFLQASREGEAALLAAVREGVGNPQRVLDAFCGLGTFAVPLSGAASVTAVDIDGPSIGSLESAARHMSGRKALTAMRRNLMRHPLGPAELKGFDAVVFDPPRAGAKGLAASLAASGVPAVVAVSCEPATLARDCAQLVAGGYKITHALPVDQFVATAHIEAVVTLRRDA